VHVDLFEFRKLLTYPSVLTNISVFFVTHTHTHVTVVRYDTGCYFNVRSNADMSQLIAKFHYTGSTGPDETRVFDKVRGLCLVGSGRVGPVWWNLAIDLPHGTNN